MHHYTYSESEIEDLIIYEDDIFLIANKPQGMATQGDLKHKDANLFQLLESLLKARAKKSPLFLHHRLDAATSGLVLFCKNPKFNKYCTDLFREKRITKNYYVIVQKLNEKALEDQFEINKNIKTFKVKHFKKAKVSENQGDEALTSFEKIDENAEFAILIARPKTGRLHQIRVHLASANLPIVGDFHYNSKKTTYPLMLHAQTLKFIHPISKKELSLEAPLPPHLIDFSRKFFTPPT